MEGSSYIFKTQGSSIKLDVFIKCFILLVNYAIIFMESFRNGGILDETYRNNQ